VQKSYVPEAGDHVMEEDGRLEPGQVHPRAQPLAAAEGCERARGRVRPVLPPPRVEGVWVVVDAGVEVHAAEVEEDAPALGDEVTTDLHVPHRLPHDPVDDVAQAQRLRDHLHQRNTTR
jgi:hypothetical protein